MSDSDIDMNDILSALSDSEESGLLFEGFTNEDIDHVEVVGSH